MHFVAHRKLNNDTSATINSGIPEGFLSLVVEWKIINDDDRINLSFFSFNVTYSQLLTDSF